MKKIIKWSNNRNFVSTLIILVVTTIVSVLGISIMQGMAASNLLPGSLNVGGPATITGGAVIASSAVTTGLAVINGNVGLGTGAPTQKLHVAGTTYLNGNVGIKTAPTTSYTLEIAGNIRTTSWSYFGNGFGVYGSGIWVDGSVNSGGGVSTSGNIHASGNSWGSCGDVTTGVSCSTTFTLTCPSGRFMIGITNTASHYECTNRIRCCEI